MKSDDQRAGPLITIREVAQYTGLSIHTLYAMVSQRRIPYVKLGGALKFDPVKLHEWIKAHSVMPMPERKGAPS